MKRIKVNTLKGCNAIISFLLALLGFACQKETINDMPAEYGSPHATFKVLGKINDATNSKPIKGVQVVFEADTAYSDINGNYSVQATNYPTDHSFKIEFNDIDGEKNGSYESLEKLVEFKDAEFTGQDGWYSGETSNDLNVNLTPKE